LIFIIILFIKTFYPKIIHMSSIPTLHKKF